MCWLMNSALLRFDFFLIFLHITGIIYDVIVEPPSVGSMTDEHGHQRPVAFLAYRYVSHNILNFYAARIISLIQS